ncbi:ABC transporter substrate-binding protein [Sneathiella litorea]|uniref:PhnD/SsuA/transferrin family substrate-binding protein n=1 Tax=Sneathiella litorea TaxID=2606216 RepID=A0A6L8W7R4_9PROT|nr:ABC transporter substrate-binding protein [Sneathiella litorea]MZR30563.1 PhnD/SsuA/transferrin family substrate-binding protein [Sneathiella litorea]
MKRRILVPLICALMLQGTTATAAEKLTVLLDWFVNPDHATLIIAQEKGLFKKHGLDVELVAPADPSAPPKLVAAGKADLAISYQPQLYMQVTAGLPIKRIATLVATPLNSLVVLEDGPIETLADLKGKKIGYSVGGFETALLTAMLAPHNITMEDVTLINVNFSLSPSLLSGQVDAVIGAFRNFELNQMEIEDEPGRAFYPEEEGVPAYDELIVIAHSEKLDDPRFKPFVEALEEAVQYLVNHPEDSWELFIKNHGELDDELNQRAWDDTLPRFALRPAALDVGRYERFAAFMQKQGLIKETKSADSYAAVLK